MDNETFRVRVLIVNDDSAETADIKKWLDEEMRVPWTMGHCMNVKEARSRINSSDVVILKPEMQGVSTPKEVFSDIEDIAFDVPILVLVNSGDNNTLSTYVMERGAADIVVRGQFSRLVDAIEFALIRQKLKTDARKDADQVASAKHVENLAELQKQKDQSDTDLEDMHQKHQSDNEKSRQTLRMFMGDYSVDPDNK